MWACHWASSHLSTSLCSHTGGSFTNDFSHKDQLMTWRHLLMSRSRIFKLTVILLILMCKTLRTYEWFEFLIIFLCSSYRYIIYTHFDKEKSIRYFRPRISNVWEKRFFKSDNTIWLWWDFCRIWKKWQIPTGTEIRYSPTFEPIVKRSYFKKMADAHSTLLDYGSLCLDLTWLTSN